METPTSLPTPPDRAAAYQLKAWTEADALGLVDIAEQFSLADNIPEPPGVLLFNYQHDQDVVRLAAQEALHRFPEASFKEKLDWRIALADTLQDSANSDAWILQQIEDGLNSGMVTPDDLDALLNPFGFQIGQRQPAPNLFGDGKPAQVLWITWLEWGKAGLYAALRQDDQGRYTLTKINGYSFWSFNWGSGQEFTVEDHTGDGVPEVIFNLHFRNGSFCWNPVYIYQWEKDQFVDISQGQFNLPCEEPLNWKYGTPGENGAEPIETIEKIEPLERVYRIQIYNWNGSVYELSQSYLESPEKFNDSAAAWLVDAMNEGEYGTVTEKVQQFLSDEAQREGVMKTDYGPSYPDYLRFQLGLAYAFQSDADRARAILEQIIQAPDNPLTTTLSQAARAYLDKYTGDADLYRACQAALKVMEKASGTYPFSKDTADYARLRRFWGYAPYSDWDSLALCNLNNAFKHIASRLDGTKFAMAPALLTRAGVSLRATVNIDLNQDGQDEWVLLVNTPGDDAPVNLWVLLNTDKGVTALPVVPWEYKSYDLPLENAYAAGLSVKTILSPEGSTLAFIRSGEFLYSFRLDAAKPSIEWALWPHDALVTYNVYPQDGSLELEVTSSSYYCKFCTDHYRWNDQEFQSYDPREEQAAKAEAMLLDQWNADEAIPLLKTFAWDEAYPNQARLLYLLGLAYELKGDDARAVQTYWKLWREHPESAYARLAQAKLEFK